MKTFLLVLACFLWLRPSLAAQDYKIFSLSCRPLNPKIVTIKVCEFFTNTVSIKIDVIEELKFMTVSKKINDLEFTFKKLNIFRQKLIPPENQKIFICQCSNRLHLIGVHWCLVAQESLHILKCLSTTSEKLCLNSSTNVHTKEFTLLKIPQSLIKC